MEIATFGAGCFWGVEAAFIKVKGVVSTKVGYMGGNLDNPTYEDVCTDRTGHTEVVEVKYDPKKISYEELLDVFWNIHDPTQLNRQGPDTGSQYRSVIFYYDDFQRKKAEESKLKLENIGKFKNKIVTSIEPAKNFWQAEEYHQKYFEKNQNSSCNTSL